MATKKKTADKAKASSKKETAKKADSKKTAAKPAVKKTASKPEAKKSTAAKSTKAAAKSTAKKPVAKKDANTPAKGTKFKKPVTTQAAGKTISKAKELSKGEVGRVGKEVVTSESISAKATRTKSSDKPATKPEAKTLAKGKEAAKVKPKKAKAKSDTNSSVPPEADKGKLSKKAPIPKTIAKPGGGKKKPGDIAEEIDELDEFVPLDTDVIEDEDVDTGKSKKQAGGKSSVGKPQISLPTRRVLSQKPTPAKTVEDNRTRFSDEELEEFKELIHKKLKEAKNDFEMLKDSLSNKDNGTDDTSPTFKLLEDGSDVLTKEETAQLAVRQQKFIQNLEMALVRIENKSYGICRSTGKLISKERLRVVPHATLSIEAKSKR
jgi:DnaK suppressor protein